MQVTSRTIRSISTHEVAYYQMWIGKVLIGTVKKIAGKFCFEPTTSLQGYLCKVQSKTMKSVKESILFDVNLEPDLTKSIRKKNKVEKRLTVRDAIKQAGLSHNEVKQFLKEIYHYHKYMKKHQFGAYMIRRVMENTAEWPYGESARKWLRENTKTGIYRPFRIEETGDVISSVV